MITGSTDVEITNTHLIIDPPSMLPVQTFPVAMVFKQDEIALESNETFTLTFCDSLLTLFGVNSIIRGTMTGTVIDSTGKDIELQ